MKRKPIWIALISSVVTVCATLLVMNFATGEKKIKRQIERRYGVDDPQFVRSMSSLLGPPLLAGNSVKALVNGERIFPEMLAAIRAAERTITFETYISGPSRSAKSSPTL